MLVAIMQVKPCTGRHATWEQQKAVNRYGGAGSGSNCLFAAAKESERQARAARARQVQAVQSKGR